MALDGAQPDSDLPPFVDSAVLVQVCPSAADPHVVLDVDVDIAAPGLPDRGWCPHAVPEPQVAVIGRTQ